ncbi:COA8 family protein CG14806, mitochondrial-like [Macrosteles quadrilineatus]|uniref:COA8 family protein CG14806, mitochondrial-like n=1 Tax=Macrosteles quadrilineatus TaxID=74068 RepID=UPI0023E1BA13|nr:COA8 family protein CG14806, mitochondrial-like [Macrosteles quadrilineatus]
MASLGSVKNPVNVRSFSNFYVTIHGKYHQQQVLLLNSAHSSTKPITEDSKCDMIGPPDPVSNLRPIKFHIPANETSIEKRLRLKRQEVQQWNQDFWASHNSKFVKERKEFMATNQSESSEQMSADEMSVFYKAFLDKNWRTHLDYNVEWYKKNAFLVLLHIQVKLSRLRNTLSGK